MTTNPQGIVDAFDFSQLVAAAAHEGPKVTITVPTEVRGTTGGTSAAVLTGLLKTAAAELAEQGLSRSEAAELLAPIEELAGDSSYWRRQSRGFAAFAAPGFHLAVRIPIEVEADLTVSDRFRVVPLVPLLENSGRAYVLALSKNSVRLFDATRNTIAQLPQGGIPTDFDAVVGELPEHQLQQRAVGGGHAAFHGHGGSDDTDSMLTEKFLRGVGEAVGAELGTARSQPLVLAAVAEYLPIFTAVCPYPVIHDEVIAGNPEHTSPDELRSQAWRLLAARTAAAEAEEAERALSLVHNGRGSLDLAEVAQAAGEGRVETLYLPRDARRLASPDAAALADAAVIDTVRTRGAVRTLGEWERADEVIATFRY